MSAAENKATTEAAYEAFGKGDLESALAVMANDIEWIVPGTSTISGTYRGKDEVAQFFLTLAGKSYVTTPERFVAEDDIVVVLTRVSVGEQQSDQADVCTFRDGKLVKFQSALDTSMQEAVWGSQ